MKNKKLESNDTKTLLKYIEIKHSELKEFESKSDAFKKTISNLEKDKIKVSENYTKDELILTEKKYQKRRRVNKY